jgi:hypothetical protein
MKPFTTTQAQRIASNLATACRDISKLNATAYRFISGCPGFIAHYDLHGFIAHYSGASLRDDILGYQRINQWHNFRPGEREADYYHSKRDVYNTACARIIGADIVNRSGLPSAKISFMQIGV